jgi:Skp family chaperone for outer membrane proteins
MEKIMRLMLLGLVLLATTAAMAKDFTAATVNFEDVFNAYPGTVKAQKKLDDLIKEKQGDLNDAQQVIVVLRKELKDPTLLPEDKKRKEREIKTKQKALIDEKNLMQGEIVNRKKQMMRELVTEVDDIISNTAIKDNVDMVVERNTVHYMKTPKDLTDEIVAGFPKTAATN